ncbi:hypothetical protein [Nocardia brasiliensis]|uniref:hypothetical protein n=1 Tax=Nocardia brasiliensis TaxID=37326 RepID=UPI002456614B|nr:hypothetical protein [Nocardia brasiliensis]
MDNSGFHGDVDGDDLMAKLHELHRSLGSPSPALLRVYLDQHGIGRSTAYDLLTPGKITRPSWNTVEGFVNACADYAGRKRLSLPAGWDDIRSWQRLFEQHRATVNVRLKTANLELRGTWQPNATERAAAWELYVELITRVALVPLADDTGSDREAMNSLHQLFGIHREVLRRYGPTIAEPKSNGQYNLAYLAVTALNYVIRPFLTSWHPLLADMEARRPSGIGAADYERQWCRHDEFRAALTLVRKELHAYAQWLSWACDVPDLLAAVPPVSGPGE